MVGSSFRYEENPDCEGISEEILRDIDAFCSSLERRFGKVWCLEFRNEFFNLIKDEIFQIKDKAKNTSYNVKEKYSYALKQLDKVKAS